MRIVLDTNVLVSALLMGGGAPRQVIRLCLGREITPLIGAALFAEYEDVLSRETLFAASPVSAKDRDALFDAVMSVSEWVQIYYLWRPNLRDEDDNHLVELAIAGGAAWIVTANVRDFRGGDLRMDGLEIGPAGAFLDQWEERS